MKNNKFKKLLLMLSVMSSPIVVAEVIDNNIAEASEKSGIVIENGKSYFYKNGVKQSDVLEIVNGKQYYFEDNILGSSLAKNKWSYSLRNKVWYYSDANGMVLKTSATSPYSTGVVSSDSSNSNIENTTTKLNKETANSSNTNSVAPRSYSLRNNQSDQSNQSKVVFIDPGHGGYDSGAAYYGLKEKDLALQVYNKLYAKLQSQGYTVLSSRTSDKYVDFVTERSAMANRSNADMFISLHFNASGREAGSSAQGIETYWYQSYAEYPSRINKDKHDDPERLRKSKLLAEAIHKNLISSSGATDRGIQRNTFAVLRETAIPAVLLELGYMDNYSESQKIRQSSYQDKLVDGIVKGINVYTGFSGNVINKNGIVTENGKKYLYKNGIKQSDVLETISGKQYYFEPTGWGSNMAINKWSRSEKTNTWYYSDANGELTKTQYSSPYEPQQKNGIVTENGKKYLYKNGIKQSDVLETINGKQYYFEPTGWGSNMAVNKWSRSEKTNTWYYSDANGEVTKTQYSSPYEPQQKNGIVTENGKKYLYKNGIKQSDVLETINGKQYYFEPTGWGSNMAISKWSRSEKTNTWYYSDANGVVTKTQSDSPYAPQQKNGIVTENGKKYLYKNGVKQSDVLETINGKQYYFEPTGWGSNMAVNKWSRSEKTNTWYYSDANGVVTKTQSDSPYAPQQKNGIVTENGKKYLYKNGVKQSDVLETINGKQYYFEPTGWGSNMAVNKWSRSEKTNTWYYSDANGVVTNIKVEATTNSNNKVTYYTQNDASWGSRRYGRWTMTASGCVPTSLSMAISTLKTPVKPYEIADYLYYNTNYYNKKGIGTISEGVTHTLNRYGLNYNLITNAEQLKAELANGRVVYAAVGGSSFVTPGYTHAVVLRGLDSKGNTTVYNPYSPYGIKNYNYNFVWNSKSWDREDYVNGTTPMIAIY